MSVQHERLIDLCNELRLGGVATQYSALAQTAAEKRTSFTDFLEELLVAERESRRARAREMSSVPRTWYSSDPRGWARLISRSRSATFATRRVTGLAS